MIELERKLEQVRKEVAAKSEELRRLRTQEKGLKKLIKSVNKALGKSDSSKEFAGQNGSRNEAKIS